MPVPAHSAFCPWPLCSNPEQCSWGKNGNAIWNLSILSSSRSYLSQNLFTWPCFQDFSFLVHLFTVSRFPTTWGLAGLFFFPVTSSTFLQSLSLCYCHHQYLIPKNFCLILPICTKFRFFNFLFNPTTSFSFVVHPHLWSDSLMITFHFTSLWTIMSFFPLMSCVWPVFIFPLFFCIYEYNFIISIKNITAFFSSTQLWMM